ncbi:hypothetical protein [Caproiciproducens sp. CPB-2]|uniref:hypothetical protein n=1 Tax=Caproiciproducens sp. CPB-2 TaxID=3030017 RepID=UPI0023DBF000|nr:hypothetical protein [Caproiciproducens sp. CPB-2]MDF1494066.1 hypothetical protein [Caproiciproducens sp. CPB-2]
MDELNGLVAAIGVISTVCAILFGYAAFNRNRKKDDQQGGEKSGTVLTEIGYIKSGIDDIKRKQERQEEKQEAQHLEVISRLTSVEASAKQAHKRIDRLEGNTE